MKTMSLSRMAALIGCRSDDPVYFEGAAVDSRLVQPKNVFFALDGENTDGHKFIGEAISKGAVAAVVRCTYNGPGYGAALIRVESPFESLQKFAKKYLEEQKVNVVAITGSVGKTTTKDFLTQIISRRYCISSTIGNANSQIGLPLTILNQVDGQEEWLVLEMGMTLPGHISSLVKIAPPKIALITSAALVHAGNFSSLQEIAHAKGEIFCHPKTEWGIYPSELPYADEINQLGTCRKVSFSVAFKGADYYLESKGERALLLHQHGQAIELGQFSIPGKHNQHNFLAAVSAARMIGMEWEEIKAAMHHLCLPEKRLQFHRYQGIVFVNDSYNASVVSVKAALDSLPEPVKGRQIAVLGDMLELGKFSEECHREIGEAAAKSVDLLFCIGPESRASVEAWKQSKVGAYWFSKKEELIDALRAHLQPGDVVLIKGSRGMQMWTIFEELVQP